MNFVVDYVSDELKKLPGYDNLTDEQKGVLATFTSISVACLTIQWICEHKDEIKEMLKKK